MYDYCATCKYRQPAVMGMHLVAPTQYWCLMYVQQPEMCKAGRSCGLWRRAADPRHRRDGEAHEEAHRR